jgi:hypothetical protein
MSFTRTPVDGETTDGTHDFTIRHKVDTASINVFFAASSPSATVEVQAKNNLADDAGESDPYSPLSGASYTETTSDGLTGLTAGHYRIEITGAGGDPIYVEVTG